MHNAGKKLYTKNDFLIPTILGITMMGLLSIVSLNLPIVLVFIPGVIASYIIFLKTFYRKPAHTKKFLSIYLLALGIQFIHFTEEYIHSFPVEIANLLGTNPYPMQYWVVFNMLAYFIFILGGIILYEEKKEYLIISIFFILVGVILNGFAHVLISIFTGGYFPGLYSALLYFIIGPVLINKWVNRPVAN